MPELTILSEGGAPNTQMIGSDSGTVHPECWETTRYLEAEETRTLNAAHKTLDEYRANPIKELLENDQKAGQVHTAARNNRHSHCYHHTFSGRVVRYNGNPHKSLTILQSPNGRCDWRATHDLNGTRIAPTSLYPPFPLKLIC